MMGNDLYTFCVGIGLQKTSIDATGNTYVWSDGSPLTYTAWSVLLAFTTTSINVILFEIQFTYFKWIFLCKLIFCHVLTWKFWMFVLISMPTLTINCINMNDCKYIDKQAKIIMQQKIPLVNDRSTLKHWICNLSHAGSKTR